MIIQEVEQGVTPGYTFDVFATIALSQLVNNASPTWANLVLTAIPCYLGYKFGGVIIGYCCPKKATTEDKPMSKEDAKRAAKKEKKQEKEKVRYIKH